MDVTQQGLMTETDLYLSTQAAGWNKQQVQQLIHELDPNHKDLYNLEEFCLIMKYIE